MEKQTVICIPAYKPTDALYVFVELLRRSGLQEIVVVDDGSGSSSYGVFNQLYRKVHLITHVKNEGKGAAIKTGLQYIERMNREHLNIILCDCDGQHSVKDILNIKRTLDCHPDADLILGKREFTGKVPLKSKAGNILTRWIYTLSSGLRISDTQTGLRGFPGTMIPFLLNIKGNRYEYEMYMLLEAAKEKKQIIEIPIETIYIDNNSGSHFHPLRDSLLIYKSIIMYSCVSITSFGLDFALFMVIKGLTSSWNPALSLFVSAFTARILSAGFNYQCNRKIVFKENGSHSLIKYTALVIGILIANYLLLLQINGVMQVPLLWSKLLAETILFAVSYLIQKHFIFKSERRKATRRIISDEPAV